MCGIFFSIGFKNPPASVIDSVAHRGPDGRGWNEFTSPQGPVVMAHRRLAIVDLSADGHQPMPSVDGRFWITYNGEIYNHLEIRKELEILGCHFNTKTDTEVLLKSYLQWGEKCLDRLNGMFSFIIWDNKENIFFAARDRFGVKPLYYYSDGEKIAFASEIKQFKALQGWSNTLNQEMVSEYLETGLCDHEKETLYKNVFQILPGFYLKINKLTEIFSPICWYDLKSRIKPSNLSDSEAILSFKDLFFDAALLRLRSDVPVGSCLSGGLDSSSIVSIMRDIHDKNQKIHTFSSVFPGHQSDESIYIDELVSKKQLTSHKNHPTLEVFLESLDKILNHQDLPFSGTSVFAQWNTFQSAKKEGITVLLDGQGADESLLGYPGMLNTLIFNYAKKIQWVKLFKFLKWQHTYNNQGLKKTFLLGLQKRMPRFYLKLLQLGGRKRPEKEQKVFSNLNDHCFWHFSTSLQTLLRYEDRNSMAFSRESRLPFLDYRLVEFVLSLPVNQRFRNTETKWVLRKSMVNINIKSILSRKDKIGFSTPENIWWDKIKNSGLLSEKDSETNFHEFIFNRWLKNEKF